MITRHRSLRLVASTLVCLLLSTLALAVTPTAGAAPAVAISSPSEAEATFATKLNQERVSRGLPALVIDTKLAATARDWSSQMNARNSLAHDPGLAADVAAVEPSWQAAAENIGVGYDVQQLHDAFMGSPGHLHNIVGDYNRLGVGVTTNGAKIWVTFRFLRGPAIAGVTGLVTPGVATPLSGDFNGDGRADLFAYGPGSGTDEVWFGNANKTLGQAAVSIVGQYRPAAGDFDGDGRTEILWYAPGSPSDYLWSWNGTSWVSKPMTILGTYAPLVGDYDGDGVDDLLWYAAGSATDYYWYGNRNDTFTSVATAINGSYRPVIGNFDNTAGDDLFWYAPGSASDWIWYSTGARGSYTNNATVVNGLYTAFAANLDGRFGDDIYWYAPGGAADYLWFAGATRSTFTSVQRNVDGYYLPAPGDFDGNHADDIAWFNPSSAAGDPLWWSTAGSTSPTLSSVHG